MTEDAAKILAKVEEISNLPDDQLTEAAIIIGTLGFISATLLNILDELKQLRRPTDFTQGGPRE